MCLPLFFSCSIHPVVYGSGNIVTGNADYNDFSVVNAGPLCALTCRQGDYYEISVRADDNVMEYIKLQKSGENLEITLNEGFQYRDITFAVDIVLPDLREVDIEGASKARIEPFAAVQDVVLSASGASRIEVIQGEAPGVTVYLSGASSLSGAVQCGKAALELSGASRAELRGAGEEVRVEGSGASQVYFKDFPSARGSVSLDGASFGQVYVGESLDVVLTGASQLEYYGSPKISFIEISGGSRITSCSK